MLTRLLLLTAFAACVPRSPQVARTDKDEWTVTLTRSSGPYSVNSVVVTPISPTRTRPIPNAGFVAAHAWQDIAISARYVDEKLAAFAAREGLRELAAECPQCTERGSMLAADAEYALVHGPMWAATSGFMMALDERLKRHRRLFPSVQPRGRRRAEGYPGVVVAAIQATPVVQLGPNEWSIQVVVDGVPGTVVTTTKPTRETPAPHVHLAAARAWYQIASTASDPRVATMAARTGLEEISKVCGDCTRDHVLFIAADAEESLERGDFTSAANGYLRALGRRMRIYVRRSPAVKPQATDVYD